jgi:hypothetical protein
MIIKLLKNIFRKWLSIFMLTMLVLPGFSKEKRWKTFKKKTIIDLKKIEGSCTKVKANFIMDLIHKEKLEFCVEIGDFTWQTFFAISKAIQYNKRGQAYAFYPVFTYPTSKVYDQSIGDYCMRNTIYLKTIRDSFYNLIIKNQLKHCFFYQISPEIASSFFENNSIDFIHFNIILSEKKYYDTIFNFFPKIKKNGYILFSNANLKILQKAIFFLFQEAVLIKDKNEYVLLKK